MNTALAAVLIVGALVLIVRLTWKFAVANMALDRLQATGMRDAAINDAADMGEAL